MKKLQKTPLGFVITVKEDGKLNSFTEDKGFYYSEEMADLYKEYSTDHTALETDEFFQRFMKVLKDCTKGNFKGVLQYQSEGGSKEVVALVESTVDILIGERWNMNRRIPLELYDDMLRHGLNKSSGKISKKHLELLNNVDNSKFLYYWITSDSLGLQDLFLFAHLMLGSTDKTLMNKELSNGKRYARDTK